MESGSIWLGIAFVDWMRECILNFLGGVDQINVPFVNVWTPVSDLSID